VNVLDTLHAFSEGEWALVRTIADDNGLDCSRGGSAPAPQRLRFLLDFGYTTGLRASERVGTTLGRVETDVLGDHWLRVTGKRKNLARRVAAARVGRARTCLYFLRTHRTRY
jgi:site-specific recombinase XerD